MKVTFDLNSNIIWIKGLCLFSASSIPFYGLFYIGNQNQTMSAYFELDTETSPLLYYDLLLLYLQDNVGKSLHMNTFDAN